MSFGVKIKICGLKRDEDIAAVNRYLPDYAGFVFCKKSRRYVPPDKARKLREALDPRIIPVGVFLDNTEEEILEAAETVDVLQFHGLTSPEKIPAIRELLRKNGKAMPIIEAFSVNSREDLTAAAKSPADMVLLDNGAGGTGERFDWSILSAAGGSFRPYFLAGGLGTGNLKSALETLSPYAVDLSSGVETDGVKDENKIREVIRIVREYGSGSGSSK